MVITKKQTTDQTARSKTAARSCRRASFWLLSRLLYVSPHTHTSHDRGPYPLVSTALALASRHRLFTQQLTMYHLSPLPQRHTTFFVHTYTSPPLLFLLAPNSQPPPQHPAPPTTTPNATPTTPRPLFSPQRKGERMAGPRDRQARGIPKLCTCEF